MTKQYLDKRDTDYVRDNLIFNYILGSEQELLTESFVHNNGIDLRFDPKRFYFFITGSHKKFTPPFTPDSFTTGVANVYTIFDLFSSVLSNCGYTGRTFQIKEDNSKQFGVLFSPCSDNALSPGDTADRLHEAYMNYSSLEHFSSTSFVGPYSGYEQIHQAFLDARELNDLLFFGIHNVVITRAYRDKTARPCDVTAILGNVRRLITTICTGTLAQALKQADYILREMIAPSYSMDNFTAMYTAVDDLLGMLCTVYPEQVRIERRAQASFFTLEDYRLWLRDIITAIFAQLRDIPRYSPTILMALSCINRNYARELSLTQLSEYVYANASVLSSQFNDEVGMSLSEYVTGLRIKKAQELLRNTDLTVPDIAGQTGFTSAKYFREIFKKQTGLSPQGYREKRME
ncbi:MAG: helix-turn-helix domain-containing protein [Clostridia bacterium]|nr:helix-turn-helix domain-containing protein [Clostridia bacterium]